MPKSIIVLLFILIIGLAFVVQPVFAELSLTIQSSEPFTSQDNITVNFSGLSQNKDCLALYVMKDNGTYLHQTGASLLTPCGLDSSIRLNTYINFTPNNTSSKILIGPFDAGSYKVYAQDYNYACNVNAGPVQAGCAWKLVSTSSNLDIDVQNQPTGVNLSITIDPSAGAATDRFVAKIALTTSDNSPISQASVALTVDNFGSRSLGTTTTDDSGNASLDISNKVLDLPQGNYDIKATTTVNGLNTSSTAKLIIIKGKPGSSDSSFKSCKDTDTCVSASGQLCDQDKGVMTAIGCIHTEPSAFIKDTLTLVSGIAGGVAFLLMVYGAFQMITSSGNPQTLKTGQDRLVSAIIGLLFVVFSVLLLQIIGVDILHIIPKT